MQNNKLQITSLRAARKATHLAGKAVRKGGTLLEKVEHKTSRIIINKSGSISGAPHVSLPHFLHQQFPYMTPLHPALPVIGQRPSVTVFAFLSPRGFYGGIATLLLVGAKLANELGYDFRIAQTTGYSDKTDVLGFLAANGISIEPERYSTIDVSHRTPESFAYLPLHAEDVILVSAWWDAHIAAQLPLQKKFVYLIQDYEPIFYNNGDSQQFAEATYFSEKFIPVCNTELLHDFMKASGHKYIAQNAISFEPAIGRPAAHTSPSDKKRRLFLYGRPNVHRNMFHSALKAIDIAMANPKMKEYAWEIFCAGEDYIPSIAFSNGNTMKNLGKMNLEDYYGFAASVDVAISPMLAPHPNYPTLEFASLGAMVVTTKWETKYDLTRYSKNILMADPTPESIANSIIEAASTTDALRRKNLGQATILTDWDTALQPMAKAVSRLLK